MRVILSILKKLMKFFKIYRFSILLIIFCIFIAINSIVSLKLKEETSNKSTVIKSLEKEISNKNTIIKSLEKEIIKHKNKFNLLEEKTFLYSQNNFNILNNYNGYRNFNKLNSNIKTLDGNIKIIVLEEHTEELNVYSNIYLINEIENSIIKKFQTPILKTDRFIVGITDLKTVDLNSDGFDDMLIEYSYPIGMGRFAGVNLNLYEIYFQDKYGNLKYDDNKTIEVNNYIQENTFLYEPRGDLTRTKDDIIPKIDDVILFLRNY